jgi:fructose-bisphosphate aldolase, class II
MSFIDGKTLLYHAYENKYGVGAFSAHNAETVQAIIEAAEELRSPVMIQVGQKVIQTLGMEPMKALIDWYGKQTEIPVCIHLDHSRKLSQTLKAIQLSFQSVMFDGSSLSFEENVEITKYVVKTGNELNIGVEGEIGKIGGTEDDITVDENEALITGVEEALAFTDATNVDYLAVSIGTAHGIYQREPHIRFDRLEEISKEVQRPVVLHGGSDVPDHLVQKAISLGISKINVDTELRQSFTQGVQEYWNENPKGIVLADSLGAGKEKMKDKVKEKIKVFGSEGQADHINYLNRSYHYNL